MSILKTWGDFNAKRKDFLTYLTRIRKDGGTMLRPDLTEKLFESNRTLAPVTKLMWSAVGAISPRVSGVNTFVQKGYDMGKLGNDLTQTTAASQPNFSKIAPVEKGGLKNANGQTKYMTHLLISFGASDKWTVETVLNWNCDNNSDCSICGNVSPVSLIGIKKSLVNRFSIYNSVGTYLTFSNGSSNSVIGKSSIIHFIAKGNSTIELYKNGIYIESLSIASGIYFSQLFKTDTIFLTSTLSHHAIFADALSPSLIASRAAILRNIYPEIESVPIGTQTWAVRNYEAVCTPQGNLIPEVQSSATWATSQTLYDNAYAAASGTVEEKTYAGVKAAAMWCHYNNDAANGVIYGKLYNWFAVKLLQMDIDYYNAANPSTPWGWRISSIMDWQVMSYGLGGSSAKIKSLGLDYWNTPNTGATNETGFTMLAGGQCINIGGHNVLKVKGEVFTSDSLSSNGALVAASMYNDSVLYADYTQIDKRFGYNIRLIKSTNEKLVTVGDSITEQQLWIPSMIYLSQNKYSFSTEENKIGSWGYKPTAMGSSKIVPLINNTYEGRKEGNSIYERVDDVDKYKPTTILLFGGQNDTNESLGTISDVAYTGGAVSSNPPTFFAAYKGTLEKLINQNPNARIICITPYYTTDVTYNQKLPYVDAIISCASLYGLQSIDLMRNSGINSDNYTTYLSDGVHPNAVGGVLIGSYIATQL